MVLAKLVGTNPDHHGLNRSRKKSFDTNLKAFKTRPKKYLVGLQTNRTQDIDVISNQPINICKQFIGKVSTPGEQQKQLKLESGINDLIQFNSNKNNKTDSSNNNFNNNNRILLNSLSIFNKFVQLCSFKGKMPSVDKKPDFNEKTDDKKIATANIYKIDTSGSLGLIECDTSTPSTSLAKNFRNYFLNNIKRLFARRCRSRKRKKRKPLTKALMKTSYKRAAAINKKALKTKEARKAGMSSQIAIMTDRSNQTDQYPNKLQQVNKAPVNGAQEEAMEKLKKMQEEMHYKQSIQQPQLNSLNQEHQYSHQYHQYERAPLSTNYAITTFRLLLTLLTPFIASTTFTPFVAALEAAIAATAAILVAITKLPTQLHQFILRNCCSYKMSLKALLRNSWIILLIYLNLSAKVCLAGYHEKRLLHDLLDPYNTLERPVLNESDPLQLSFGLTLMQIIDVDEKNQLLVTNVWLKLEWNDMNLRWNTSDYGGIKDLRIPPHRIWKPDVLMYNSADEGFDGTYQTNVVVRNNGSCLYVPPGIFKSTCKIDITWFPFDDQRCEMKFGSWTYDGFQLDLQLQDETGGDISSYVLNGEWELLGVPGKRNEIYYNCCPEPYIDITFSIIIRRRTLYYFFNLIIPCVLIASMALLGFTLPPDSGEKLSLGVTILLSLTVFLNMVAETMPATSDAVPLLGTYFNCIMFMVASSVVSTILVLNYHHRNADTHEMSEWIRIVFLCWLPWILRMSRPGRPLILEFPTTPCSDSSSDRKHQILSDVELKERSSKSLLANVLDIDDDFRHGCRPMTPGGTLPHNPAFYRTVYGQGDDGSIGPIGSTRMPDAVTHHTCIKSSTEYELSLILKEIRFITDQLRKEDEENDIANDWKFAAMVVDRLCLIIFTMFAILATMAVLLSAPHVVVS